MFSQVATAGGEVDLSSAWDGLWNAITSGVGPGLPRLMAAIGVALVAWAIVKWAWDRRRGGGGGGGGGIMGALVIGAILAAPSTLLPIALTLVDGVANAGIKIWNSANIT